MRRHIPTFSSLLCFEASARHLSFTRAAEELNLTQSAVSRQVQNLEEFLNTELFTRFKKRLTLTPEGEAFAQVATAQLDTLEAESLKLISKDLDNRTLNLGTFPAFGSQRLIPALPDFTRQHPEIQLNITTTLVPFNFTTQDIDIAIQHGDGNWPDVEVIELIKEEVVAVCSPRLLENDTQATPESVFSHPMLHLKTRQYAWPEWLEANKLEKKGRIHGPQFETFGYMVRAALSGLGIAIVPPVFIEEELASGELISPFGAPIQSQRGYFLVTPDHKKNLEKVRKFSEWFLTKFDKK